MATNLKNVNYLVSDGRDPNHSDAKTNKCKNLQQNNTKKTLKISSQVILGITEITNIYSF